jgi:glycosyltransferase involved in cell wall biosynthesis
MFLSIIIPTHNRARYLKMCLEALTSSTSGHSDCEVIVVDDHSELDIARCNQVSCENMHANYLYLKKNCGAAAARNVGIEKAKGEWVAFLDDDVCVEPAWYSECKKALSNLVPNIIGLEGMVIATGNGVWDKEVENLNGKAYLSCHIIYRKDLLRRIGGFDGHFTGQYPACEDHELAIRALFWGDIVFNPHLRVRHLPRTIHCLSYIKNSFHRMKSLLEAEFYFFMKHRDRYHVVRHARTFWGTYRNILFLHCLVSLRRRPAVRLFKFPLQSLTLIIASLLEQLTAFCLSPQFMFFFFPHHGIFDSAGKNRHPLFFKQHIDEKRTCDLWLLSSRDDIEKMFCKPLFLRSLFFPMLHRPVYSIVPVIKQMKGRMSQSGMRIFLRIDDVFMSDPKSVSLLCEKLARRNIPFCAGVTGKDLGSERAGQLVDRIRQSGGEIALHGFTHSGTFGPFTSEILQMKCSVLNEELNKLFNDLPVRKIPAIFIPPYNAINRDQIVCMTRHFKVICGGPETARFTDCASGPVALENDAWYFPSFYPFYSNAAAMTKSQALRLLEGQMGFICITVHMPDEAKDGFAALMRLIGGIADAITPWDYFFSTHYVRGQP